MARGTGLSTSTVRMPRSGRHHPDALLVREVARVLGLSEADVRVVAGLDDAGARYPAAPHAALQGPPRSRTAPPRSRDRRAGAHPHAVPPHAPSGFRAVASGGRSWWVAAGS
ncbi:hypothetical protein [Streptomyces omiyaensis]|uniref:HTH cro/C1-type domain-containing protein n=1 Tax=Streptomyces omiyaensis TaxID=68247 RepID=A0ABW7BSH8_9ACTN